jgi:uncharacterized membrane protein YdjX (TVP38/TMEM64 family)
MKAEQGRLPLGWLALALPLLVAAAGWWLAGPASAERALAWLETAGPTGQLAFVALYVAMTVAGLPIGWLVVSAGALFGPALGLCLVTLAGLVGASLAFAIARRLGRPALLPWLRKRAGWVRLEPLLRAHGGPIVALARLLPGLPFSLQNYAFGLSSIPFRTYLVWTAVGILPSGAVTVLGAAALRDSLLGRPALGLWLGALGLGLGLALAARMLSSRPTS